MKFEHTDETVAALIEHRRAEKKEEETRAARLKEANAAAEQGEIFSANDLISAQFIAKGCRDREGEGAYDDFWHRLDSSVSLGAFDKRLKLFVLGIRLVADSRSALIETIGLNDFRRAYLYEAYASILTWNSWCKDRHIKMPPAVERYLKQQALSKAAQAEGNKSISDEEIERRIREAFALNHKLTQAQAEALFVGQRVKRPRIREITNRIRFGSSPAKPGPRGKE